LSAYERVLLLDTEGLFGLLNKAESDQRDKFDRKLILFCLVISDITPFFMA
jgi:hypothetical protein